MKPPSSVIADLLTVVLLYVFLALYMVGFFAPSPFAADHAATMWAIFAAAISFLYAFVQARQRSVLRFLALFGRLLVCISLALFIDFVVYVWWYRPDDHEWSLGAYILSFIALIYGSPAFVLGYIVRIARDRLTRRFSQPLTG